MTDRTLGPVEASLKALFDAAPDNDKLTKGMKKKIAEALSEARDIDENATPKEKKRILNGLRAATMYTNK